MVGDILIKMFWRTVIPNIWDTFFRPALKQTDKQKKSTTKVSPLEITLSNTHFTNKAKSFFSENALLSWGKVQKLIM